MTIKKNIPYKVLKGLWISLMVLLILNIIGLWVGWSGRGTYAEGYDDAIPGRIAFGVVTGVLVLLNLIACAVVAFLNQKVEKRVHGWIYAALAVVHLVFVILMFTLTRNGDNTCPALFTVFLVAIMGLMVYFALARRKQQFVFGKAETEADLKPIRREDLGMNPTEETADMVANPENNPDRKAGRDEKTGIVSL